MVSNRKIFYENCEKPKGYSFTVVRAKVKNNKKNLGYCSRVGQCCG